MTITIENITKPNADPVKGDWVRIRDSASGNIVEKEFHPIEASSEEEIAIVTKIAQEARFIKEVQNFVKVNKDKR